jgi:hypothetical protein
MKITYGHTVTSVDDIYVQNAEKALARTASVVIGGGALVDFFPICPFVDDFSPVAGIDMLPVKYIPTWFPGAKFKRDAQSAKADVLAQFEGPFNMVKEKMVMHLICHPLNIRLTGILQQSENVVPSFTSSLIESLSQDGIISSQDGDEIRQLAGMMFSG